MTTDFSPETASRAQVVEQVIYLIVRRRLPIDKRTSEKRISELLGFPSRRPIVREALAFLTRDGIVGLRPQWGYWVLPVSIDEAKRTLQLRAGVERNVVKELASQYRPAQLDTLKNNLEKLEEAANETDADDFLKGDDFLKENARYRSERAAVAGFLTGTWMIKTWSDKLRIFRSEPNQEVLRAQETLSEPLPSVTPHEAGTIVEGHRIVLNWIEKQEDARASAAIDEQLEEALRWFEEAQFAKIENELVLDEAVAEAAVVEIEDEYGRIEGENKGQALVAFVVLEQDQERHDGFEDQLSSRVAKRMTNDISPPDLVFVVDELPKTRSNKIVRRPLRNIARLLLQDIAEGKELRNVRALANRRVMNAVEHQQEPAWA
jgi:DNA-binding GntR family transcriptional regulator